MWNIGDKVKWCSQSNGGYKDKRGTVHAVVPSLKNARMFLPQGMRASQRKFDTMITNYDRYIIAVPRGGRSELVDYYCPRPSMLQADVSGESGGSETSEPVSQEKG